MGSQARVQYSISVRLRRLSQSHSSAVHVLFSPWLLVAIAILAWIKFRPRRSHQ